MASTLKSVRVKFTRDTRCDLRDVGSDDPAIESVSKDDVHEVTLDVWDELRYTGSAVITTEPTNEEVDAGNAPDAPPTKPLSKAESKRAAAAKKAAEATS